MPYTWGTTGLCYRSDLVKTPVDSWFNLVKPDAALKGKITMLSTDRWLMEAGLIPLGYSVNDPNPEHVKKATELLIEAKKSLLAYDDTTFYSKLVSARPISSRPGTAGAITASPRTPRSSSWCRRKARTSGSTPWSCSRIPSIRTRR